MKKKSLLVAGNELTGYTFYSKKGSLYPYVTFSSKKEAKQKGYY